MCSCKTSSGADLAVKVAVGYMGRRLSMFNMDESVEVRPLPLSVTRSLMRMLGLAAEAAAAAEVEGGGGGDLPSVDGGAGGWRTAGGCGGGL